MDASHSCQSSEVGPFILPAIRSGVFLLDAVMSHARLRFESSLVSLGVEFCEADIYRKKAQASRHLQGTQSSIRSTDSMP